MSRPLWRFAIACASAAIDAGVATAAGSGRAGVDGIAVVAGAVSDVKLVLHPGGVISGRVLVGETPAAGAGVTAQIGERWFRAESRGDGRFLIPDLPPGSFSVEASLPGLRPVEVRDIPVEAGRTAGAVAYKGRVMQHVPVRGAVRGGCIGLLGVARA